MLKLTGMSFPESGASLDEQFDIDAELEEWLRKEAASQGLDPDDMHAAELEVLSRWQKDQNKEDFEWLYNRHQPLIYSAGEKYLRSSQLPRAAVRGNMVQNYTHALQTYDPGRGALFKTHLFNDMRRTGRYLQKYTNVGKIPEERAGLIPLFKVRQEALTELFGREPSNAELADDMLLEAQDLADLRDKKITPKIVGTLRKEVRDDLVAERPGGAGVLNADSDLRRQIVFLHGSLNPQQQIVLEHTFEGFGKTVMEDPLDLAKEIGMSPQKIRALKRQIQNKVKRFW